MPPVTVVFIGLPSSSIADNVTTAEETDALDPVWHGSQADATPVGQAEPLGHCAFVGHPAFDGQVESLGHPAPVGQLVPVAHVPALEGQSTELGHL